MKGTFSMDFFKSDFEATYEEFKALLKTIESMGLTSEQIIQINTNVARVQQSVEKIETQIYQKSILTNCDNINTIAIGVKSVSASDEHIIGICNDLILEYNKAFNKRYIKFKPEKESIASIRKRNIFICVKQFLGKKDDFGTTILADYFKNAIYEAQSWPESFTKTLDIVFKPTKFLDRCSNWISKSANKGTTSSFQPKDYSDF